MIALSQRVGHRIHDGETRCSKAETQHTAWIKAFKMPKQHVDLEERHDLQQELEDLQKKAQEERDRAGGLSRGQGS